LIDKHKHERYAARRETSLHIVNVNCQGTQKSPSKAEKNTWMKIKLQKN